jgi:hypothetical protein
MARETYAPKMWTKNVTAMHDSVRKPMQEKIINKTYRTVIL